MKACDKCLLSNEAEGAEGPWGALRCFNVWAGKASLTRETLWANFGIRALYVRM